MKTNSLIYRVTKHTLKETFIIKISLADECKNGHQDFSITGSIYEKGKALTDRNMISGGAIGDEIAKAFPELAIFNRLHLCDSDGIPMYAVENGFYHLKNGFNSKSTGDMFKSEFCDYYRLTPEQFDIVSKSENKIEYALLLQDLGILAQWKEEAKQAIEQLEKLTGDEFVCDSKKSQYNAPEIAQIEDFRHKKASGYFSDELKQQRAIETKENEQQKKINDLKETAQKDINAINTELNIKLYVLSCGLSIDNMIYYKHNNTLAFNWKNYGDTISESEYNYFVENIDYAKLPEGIKLINKG